jgi:hypothetical protein
MNNEKVSLLQEKNELEEKLRYLNMGVEALQAQRIAERVGKIPEREALIETFQQIEKMEAEAQVKIDQKKTETKQIKEETDSIKQKYFQLDEEHKKDNWSWLVDPISEKSRQIAANESHIGALEQENLANYQAKAITRNEIDAYENNCHTLSEEEDPRVQAVLKEKEQLEGRLYSVVEQIKSF